MLTPRPDHAAGINEVLMRANGYRPSVAWFRREHLEAQLDRFPEGQFVAVTGTENHERVIGTATLLRTSRTPEQPSVSWQAMTGGYGLSAHDPAGAWLYGVEIAVHPDFQRRGVAGALYRARLALVERYRLRGWFAGGMLMGYHRHSGTMSVLEYGRRVLAGEVRDPTVTTQLNKGIRGRRVILDYYPEPKAGNAAVLLEWRPGFPGTARRTRHARRRERPGGIRP